MAGMPSGGTGILTSLTNSALFRLGQAEALRVNRKTGLAAPSRLLSAPQTPEESQFARLATRLDSQKGYALGGEAEQRHMEDLKQRNRLMEMGAVFV